MPPPKGPPTAQQFTELREGIDFVWEGASVVLTEDYLSSLGRCCQSGCRNCPWRYQHRPNRRSSPASRIEPHASSHDTTTPRVDYS